MSLRGEVQRKKQPCAYAKNINEKNVKKQEETGRNRHMHLLR